MPGHKRKKGTETVASSLVALTVPTLKEQMWKELTTVVQAFSTVPLQEKNPSDVAWKKFR